MKLTFNAKTPIKDIQREFSAAYPYLKIEFYLKPHEKTELSRGQERISPQTILGEIGDFVSALSIDMSEERPVADMEAEFFAKTGVAVQVSRLMGNTWIETSISDDKTLGWQNGRGRIASLSKADM